MSTSIEIYLLNHRGFGYVFVCWYVGWFACWYVSECVAEWLRRLTRKPGVRTAVGSNPALDSLVAVRNSSPGRPEPSEGNLVATAGSCGGLMVKHPWPLLACETMFLGMF